MYESSFQMWITGKYEGERGSGAKEPDLRGEMQWPIKIRHVKNEGDWSHCTNRSEMRQTNKPMEYYFKWLYRVGIMRIMDQNKGIIASK